MEKIIIYRNLPFKVWHQSYKGGGVVGDRRVCNCPYGEHRDKLYIDYKDPIHLSEILFSLKENCKLLIFKDAHNIQRVICRKFTEVEFMSDFVRLRFETIEPGRSDYDSCELASIVWIAVLPENDATPCFTEKGDISFFIKKLSKILNVPELSISEEIIRLERIPVNAEVKISSKEIIKIAEEQGISICKL